METKNYHQYLSEIQKKKKAEKLGNLCYYEWFDTLYEEYTLEEAGAILLALIYYDRTGGTRPLPKKLETIIDKDRATRTLFITLMDKTAAASKEWINKHKLKNPPTKDENENIEVEYCFELNGQPKTFTIIGNNKSKLPTKDDFDTFIDSIDYEGSKDTLNKVEELITNGNTDLWMNDFYFYAPNCSN